MFDVKKFIMFVFAIGLCGRSATDGYCAGVNWPQKDRLWTYWGRLFDVATRAVHMVPPAKPQTEDSIAKKRIHSYLMSPSQAANSCPNA